MGLLLVLLLASSTDAAYGSGPQLDEVTAEDRASEIAAYATNLGALGVYWDSERQELVVVAPISGANISSIDFAGRGLSVRTETAKVSQADLQRAKDHVGELVRDGKLKGASTEVALNLRSGQVEITSNAEEVLFAGALADLGGGGIFRPAKGDFQRLSNRVDDAPPYWGGGTMKRVDKLCSSGFSVIRAGTAYMATAGHCFNLGLSIGDGAGGAYGTVQFNAWGNPPGTYLDTELIGGQQYGGYIWMGTLANPSWANVISAADPSAGFSYCSSGQASFEKCGIPATAANLYACDPNGFCTDHMVRFSGIDWWTGTDSGGPIFVKLTNPLRAKARGTIIGEWNGNSYGQMWSAIANRWGATICTQINGHC